jgi:signal transduction histidine kinase
LRQVFFNIVLNARQAMSEAHHGGRLTVRTLQEGTVVRIEISDDGPGIAPEIVDKIFDPFFTTRPQGQGIGLGLSLCFGIVSEHGGRIWAVSPALQQYADAPGPGATLVVELPTTT